MAQTVDINGNDEKPYSKFLTGGMGILIALGVFTVNKITSCNNMNAQSRQAHMTIMTSTPATPTPR